MRHNQCVRMLKAGGAQLSRGKGGVHDAGALPDLHVLATGFALHKVAQIDVGKEQNWLLGGDRVHHLNGIARRAQNVAFGLHLD